MTPTEQFQYVTLRYLCLKVVLYVYVQMCTKACERENAYHIHV
jgi:hypothetical protein